MLAKLTSLGARVTPLDDATKCALMQAVEAQTGKLPAPYRELLWHFGGDIDFDSLVVYSPAQRSAWTNGAGLANLDRFYGLSSRYPGQSLVQVLEMYAHRMPPGWIPIGDGGGGNQVCLATTTPVAGQIALWDHETERGPGSLQRVGEPTMAAMSLETFVAGLRRDDSPPRNVAATVELKF